MPDRMDDQRPMTPETAPSELAAEEPSFARLIGTVGLGLVVIGALSIWMNVSKERLIGPTTGAFFILVGTVAMLYHAARDADQMIRRSYLGLGFAAIVAGVVLSLLPQPAIGDWLMPWGGLAMMMGVFFLLAAGRHEDEPPWDSLIPGVLTLGGISMAVAGLICVALVG